jgi:hypothetical protein
MVYMADTSRHQADNNKTASSGVVVSKRSGGIVDGLLWDEIPVFSLLTAMDWQFCLGTNEERR